MNNIEKEKKLKIYNNRFCVKCVKNLHRAGVNSFYLDFCDNPKCSRFGLYTHIFLEKS